MCLECVLIDCALTEKCYKTLWEHWEKQIPDKPITSSFSGSIKADSPARVIHTFLFLHTGCHCFHPSYNPLYCFVSLSYLLFCTWHIDTSIQMRPLTATHWARVGLHLGQSRQSELDVLEQKRKLKKCRHEEKFRLHRERPSKDIQGLEKRKN